MFACLCPAHAVGHDIKTALADQREESSLFGRTQPGSERPIASIILASRLYPVESPAPGRPAGDGRGRVRVRVRLAFVGPLRQAGRREIRERGLRQSPSPEAKVAKAARESSGSTRLLAKGASAGSAATGSEGASS